MNENPDFEQNVYSRSSQGVKIIGDDSIRSTKW